MVNLLLSQVLVFIFFYCVADKILDLFTLYNCSGAGQRTHGIKVQKQMNISVASLKNFPSFVETVANRLIIPELTVETK